MFDDIKGPYLFFCGGPTAFHTALFESARCVCCTIPNIVKFSLDLNQTWTNLHRSMICTDQIQ